MYLFLAPGGRRDLMGHLATYLANPKLQNFLYYLVKGQALQTLTVPVDLRNADKFLYHSKGAPKAKHLPLHMAFQGPWFSQSSADLASSNLGGLRVLTKADFRKSIT